jgi:hypothetical protein
MARQTESERHEAGNDMCLSPLGASKSKALIPHLRLTCAREWLHHPAIDRSPTQHGHYVLVVEHFGQAILQTCPSALQSTQPEEEEALQALKRDHLMN